MDCLRLGRVHAADLALVLRCTAQSANMMRQARGARSLLLRVQAARQKREADGAATDKAAWIEHCAVGLMADALGRSPPAPRAEPPPAPTPAPADTFGLLTEAEQYAIIHPRRAALIRSLGRLPDKCDFGPPAPEPSCAFPSPPWGAERVRVRWGTLPTPAARLAGPGRCSPSPRCSRTRVTR
jgi:hypothetical protein